MCHLNGFVSKFVLYTDCMETFSYSVQNTYLPYLAKFAPSMNLWPGLYYKKHLNGPKH